MAGQNVALMALTKPTETATDMTGFCYSQISINTLSKHFQPHTGPFVFDYTTDEWRENDNQQEQTCVPTSNILIAPPCQGNEHFLIMNTTLANAVPLLGENISEAEYGGFAAQGAVISLWHPG